MCCGAELDRYRSLPTWLHKQVGNGKFNYTIRDSESSSGRVLQIHLRERAFYVMKRTGGEAYSSQSGSPMVSWGMYATWQDAWGACREKLGGWALEVKG